MAPVAILWDMENCPVPGEAKAEDVAGNLRMALRVYPFVGSTVTMFSAYGDFNHFPRKVREGCQRTGVTLIDVPNGRKDASDKAILVDMLLFALDNPPPCTIFLISGDVDFASALHKLGQRDYTVVLAIPSGVGVASALRSAGRYVWDWPSVARGGGLVPAKTFQSRESFDAGNEKRYSFSPQESGQIARDESGQPKNEILRPVSSKTNFVKTKGHPSLSYDVILNCPEPEIFEPALNKEENKSQGAICSNFYPSSLNPSTLVFSSSQYLPQEPHNNQLINIATQERSFEDSLIVDRTVGGDPHEEGNYGIEPTNSGTSAQTSWVEPGDFQGLKRQLVELVSLHGGRLGLVRVPAEYLKTFGRPLYLAEYKSLKLTHLIVRMRDTFLIKGEGAAKTLHLTNAGMQFAMKYKKVWGNCIPGDGKESRDAISVSSPDSGSTSADEKLVDHQERKDKITSFEFQPTSFLAKEHETAVRLEAFKQDLQELLVSHACKILVGNFLTLYQLRYSRHLDYKTLGFQTLESLFEKVNDVVVLKEEEGSGRKFLIAKCAIKMDFT